MEALANSDSNGIPPALPIKRSKHRKERLPSQYDNVPENEHLSTCSLHTSNGNSPIDNSRPPPLPIKKRHSKCRRLMKYFFAPSFIVSRSCRFSFSLSIFLFHLKQPRLCLYISSVITKGSQCFINAEMTRRLCIFIYTIDVGCFWYLRNERVGLFIFAPIENFCLSVAVLSVRDFCD